MRAVTVVLPDDVAANLETRAVQRSRDSAGLAADAIAEWLQIDAWQRAEIEAAVREADRSDFATEDEMAALWRKWGAEGA